MATEYTLSFSKDLEKNLEEIFEYIFYTLNAPVAAKYLLKEIDDNIMKLKTFPYMCKALENKELELYQYHKLIVKDFIIIYSIDEQNETVNIVRAFYGASNYEAYL